MAPMTSKTLLFIALSGFIACSSQVEQSSPEPAPVSTETKPTPAEFSQLTLADGADRSLEQLDVNLDGSVDGRDVELLEQLAAAAREELTRRGLSTEATLFYEGPENGTPSVFSQVKHDGIAFEFGEVTSERSLQTLSIESRWAAKQARLASLGITGVNRIRDIGQPYYGALGNQTFDPAGLCSTLPSIDSAAFDDARVERVALFDIDRTIWNGSIIDPFLAVLIEDRMIEPVANERLKGFLLGLPGMKRKRIERNDVTANAKLFRKHTMDTSLPEAQRISAKDGFFETVALINGLSREKAAEAARKAIERGGLELPAIGSQVFDEGGCSMKRLIESLQNAGFEVYLLSATLDVLAFAAADALGVPRDKTIGSPLEIDGDRYTGKVVLSTYGIKGSITRAWLPSPPLLVFGDSASSDVPMMLEAYGAAFMVNPGESMRAKDETLAGGRFLAIEFSGVVGDG